MNLTEEQARTLLANIIIDDNNRKELYVDEIERTIENWKRFKWIGDENRIKMLEKRLG